jgi:hypothetical protein
MYQNLDLSVDKFFVSKDHTKLVTDIKQLKTSRLNRNFYFRPSGCPLVNVNDSNDGSCFKDYFIPTASYQFQLVDNVVKSVLIEKNLLLTEYIDELHQGIYNRIKSIYQQHKEVTLAYSGGIDSMVLLSFIQNQGLLSRTNVVCFKNKTQSDPSCLHRDFKKQFAVEALLKTIQNKVKSVQWLTISQDDFVFGLNNQNLEHVKCYATNAVLKKTDGNAYIFGHHGNQSLLHKIIFVDEIILNQSGAIKDMADLLSGSKDFYTQSLLNFDINSVRIGIERRHMLMKPWSLLANKHKSVYSPLADNFSFGQLRRLDFGKINISIIANADVARELIDRNVGNSLNSYITTESIKDGDNLENMVIPLDLLSASTLAIPSELNHNPEGLDYIQNEINSAKKTNTIAINTLVTIKALNWLSQL